VLSNPVADTKAVSTFEFEEAAVLQIFDSLARGLNASTAQRFTGA